VSSCLVHLNLPGAMHICVIYEYVILDLDYFYKVKYKTSIKLKS